MLDHLRARLRGKVVILGIGNILRSDDGVGSILAARIEDKVPWIVYDGAESPENYLGKIIKEKPDTVIIIDAVDFGAKPGEFKAIETEKIKAANLFFTHNTSLSVVINYLQNNLKVDIMILIIQPKDISLGDRLSLEVEQTLNSLESWFSRLANNGNKR